ncbi:MAG: 3-methyl-2-oxobutanoate hydroxymethyltransferase [Spirochaetota bacterium]|nr:MAG: 3-methyl-2-oxobutanoate hydroxymethyltransferase [Spirochaetota bacterium]
MFTRDDFVKMKKEGKKVAWVTAYDYPTAHLAQKAGMDMILVGDSLGMVMYGYDSTVPVTMDECIIHCRAVRRGAPDVFVIGDMPFLSYQISVEDSIRNAGRFLKEASMNCIKLEGGRRVKDKIRGIVDAGILVMGHIGLTPQSSGQLGGFKAQGRTAQSAEETIKDALAVQEAGAFAILLEAVPPELAKAITKMLDIPVYGIGAGKDTDGQVLICADLLGLFETFTPKFVKKYENLAAKVVNAFQQYIKDVRKGSFPGPEHGYSVFEKEKDAFDKVVERYMKER